MTGQQKFLNKSRYYACWVPKTGEKLVADDWKECEKLVKGAEGARYKSFDTKKEAEEWLAAGAEYGPTRTERKRKLEKGIYFDAGTGRGEGVEISVTDEKGKDLLRSGRRLVGKKATNNYGELLACKYALELAMKKGIRKVFGDSQLVIDYWSKWAIKKKELPPETARLAMEVSKLRQGFEKMGGRVTRISGDLNPADLGFHR